MPRSRQLHREQHDETAAGYDPDKPTTLLAFAKRFADDAACEDYLFGLRWPDGFVCPKCGSRKAWAAGPHRTMICANNHRTSVTAGTALHRTKLPATLWFYAAYLVSTLTPGISAVQLQKQLGISRYETAFQMLHKLRSGLVAPGRDKLKAAPAPVTQDDENPPVAVEIDEFFIGGPEEGHPGRGAEKKVLVVCAVEVVEWTEPDKKKPGDGVLRTRGGRLRMNVIPNASAEVLLPWIVANVEHGSMIHTDGWAGYKGLRSIGYEHEVTLQSHKGKKTGDYLPMVHLIISNLKAWLAGTFHGAVRPHHLPAYLNEFVFRFNRRFWRGPAFVRALGLLMAATDRPEYDTLYAVKKQTEGAWQHPNPRCVATPDVIEAIYAEAIAVADPTLRAWMGDNTERVRAVIKQTIEATL
jgi:transposase-like protein